MTNVSDKSKIVETNAYFSDLYNIEFLKTPSGEVYGFAYQGEIYIDETKLDPQAPIHEYTHIWDEAVMQTNPALWERGKRLLRDSNNEILRNLWNEIAQSEAYGKKWQAQGKTQEEIDNLIASEVHSRLTGEKGGELLQQIEQAQGGKGIIGKLKRWLKDVFKHIGKTFGTWTEDALNELTLDDFINMPLRDFLDGVNPNTASQNIIDDIQSLSDEDYEDEYRTVNQSEFNPDEITYDEESSGYSPKEVFSDEEWNTIYDQLIERSPLMAKQVEQGLFSKQELVEMFSDSEETNQTILEDIRRGLDNGSIKPMTIDENQEEIPLCM